MNHIHKNKHRIEGGKIMLGVLWEEKYIKRVKRYKSCKILYVKTDNYKSKQVKRWKQIYKY